MAISIDWVTKVIFVPKSDLPLITGNIFELDAEWFRLEVINIMDSEAGMSYPDAINHNTKVILSGVEYSRIIEIINGYSITFEPGPYAVSITGANTNYLDVMNFNGVSVATANSGGLVHNKVAGDVNVISVDGIDVIGPDDFKADVSNIADDVWNVNTRLLTSECTANITEVNGVPVSIDDFKADVSNLDVDLSTIPGSVWEHLTRTIQFTPEQQDQLDQILLELQNIECSGGGTAGNEWTVTI